MDEYCGSYKDNERNIGSHTCGDPDPNHAEPHWCKKCSVTWTTAEQDGNFHRDWEETVRNNQQRMAALESRVNHGYADNR